MEFLQKQFEEHRSHLRKVAFRMLGSSAEVDDAIQEAWLRLQRSDVAEVHNLGGWLTTVVARVCLDILRSRTSHREEPLIDMDEATRSTPESAVALADSLGAALVVVLDTLDPAERVSFVLHDMFDVPFDQIAPIVGRSEPATRQLASRARRRIRGGEPASLGQRARRRQMVDAFLAASRDGNLEGLLRVLAPDVILRADEDAVRTAAANKWGGAPTLVAETRGASLVAETFKGRARGAQPALIDGQPGAVWVVGGQARSAFLFTVEDERIVAIDLIMEAERLAALKIDLQ
jgi:RNA polymerase sigma-70 factor (ECF subfamily)